MQLLSLEQVLSPHCSPWWSFKGNRTPALCQDSQQGCFNYRTREQLGPSGLDCPACKTIYSSPPPSLQGTELCFLVICTTERGIGCDIPPANCTVPSQLTAGQSDLKSVAIFTANQAIWKPKNHAAGISLTVPLTFPDEADDCNHQKSWQDARDKGQCEVGYVRAVDAQETESESHSYRNIKEWVAVKFNQGYQTSYCQAPGDYKIPAVRITEYLEHRLGNSKPTCKDMGHYG